MRNKRRTIRFSGPKCEESGFELNGTRQMSRSYEATASSASGELTSSVESMFHHLSIRKIGEHSQCDATDDTSKYDLISQLALGDPQTGLPNRLLLLDRLAQELARKQRHGGHVIVFHIDLNNLADVYKELGYGVGNAALRGMSKRLTDTLRSEDTVSRVAERQLVAVMTTEDGQAVESLTQRLNAVFDDPIVVAGKDVQISANLGIVTARNAESAEGVLARAALAA
jgi:diguanylate cyclase (GGDEF)-like protein